MRPPLDIEEQIASAYRQMAHGACYRPSAPSDGMGHITVPVEELDLDAECSRYAAQWWREEDEWDFFIGCCHYQFRPATVFAVEAARLMCSADGETALRLLRMAADALAAEVEA